MKKTLLCLLTAFLLANTARLQAQTAATEITKTTKTGAHLFIDVHHLAAGKVTFADVAAAHAKDLAAQNQYGVRFLKYWVDEAKGDVYCLSSASDTASVTATHRAAHGLLPQDVYAVTDGVAAAPKNDAPYFLDVHTLGAGSVTADAVAKAHQQDLAVQQKHGVNFINYWVDEKKGVVLCLSQARDSASVVQTHKEAHGLLPVSIAAVKEGQ